MSCNPKQLDSSRLDPSTHAANHGRGCHPPWRPLPRDLSRRCAVDDPLQTTIRWPQGHIDYHRGLFPLHSPLLGESWLVSSPPLSYMLKFSGSSCLIGGPMLIRRQHPIHWYWLAGDHSPGTSQQATHRPDAQGRHSPRSRHCHLQCFSDTAAAAPPKKSWADMRHCRHTGGLGGNADPGRNPAHCQSRVTPQSI